MRLRCPSCHTFLLVMPMMGVVMGILGWIMAQLQDSASDGVLPWYGLVMGYHMLSLLFGLPTLWFALRATPSLRSVNLWLTDAANSAAQAAAQQGQHSQQLLLGQAIAAMALPPTLQTSQIVFQQSFGNRTDLLSALLGDAFPPIAAEGAQAGMPSPGEAASPDTDQDHDSQSQYDEGPPWRDLQSMSRQLARLLGRPRPLRPVPPPAAQMPHGELHAFLGALHGATSQLGVGISELQDALASGSGAEVLQALQFATALETTALTLRGLAGTIRSSLDEAASPDRAPEPGGGGVQAADAPAGTDPAENAPTAPAAVDGVRSTMPPRRAPRV